METQKPTLHLVQYSALPIYQQLQIEEALLRTDEKNWCLINRGSPPGIVMGISGKPEVLINQGKLSHSPIPIIRRFSGGGTVVVDENTLFVTFICNSRKTAVPCFPDRVLCWSEKLYRPLFHNFSIKENDYVLGDRKFGGNAQYMRKERWLHHSSLLWDFKQECMDYLLLPPKRPKYRLDRTHTDFLCTLKPLFTHQLQLIDSLTRSIAHQFHIEEVKGSALQTILERPHRKSTTLVTS